MTPAIYTQLRSRHGAPGFTLIEMILAIGVAALVLIAVNATLFAALHLRDITADAVDAASPLDRAAALLHRDLECAVPPTNGSTRVLSGSFRVGSLTSPGVNGPVSIELFTATGALNSNTPWPDIQRVSYGLKASTDRSVTGKNLVRSVTRNLLSLTAPEVQEQLLLHGVADIKFSCYDGAQWQEIWDTTSPTSASTNLPQAVRVDIQMAGGPLSQPVELLVPLGVQSLTNMVLTSSQ